MKKLILLTGIVVMTTVFSSCFEAGYVSEEPTYIEVARPMQPSSTHIWIDGDWLWRRQSRTYERRDGHWEAPRQGRTFTQGHWQSNGKGHHWISGQWQ
jgi:hypothetical protein